jgi:sugar phosphate isomerase/epimerase
MLLHRRQFLRTSISAAAASALSAWAARTPVKIAHREGNMPRSEGKSVYELAASVPGLSGLEVVSVRLWDRANALASKRESDRWKIRTVSMSGVFPQGVTLVTAGAAAEDAIRKTIRSGELLGATVVQLGGFFDTCPKMDDEASYGPAVELLKKMGPVAADAGMSLGLELSLSLAEYQKLLGLVAHPAVRPYWDATGTDHMGHPGDGIKGLEVLGASICQMHLKNGRAGKLMEERHLLEKHRRSPVPERVMSIDWPKAFSIVKNSGFEGWFAFETPHTSVESFIAEATKNVQFVMRSMA